MSARSFNPSLPLVCLAVFFAALSRLLPHPFNFTPIGAIALFGGAGFANKAYAFGVPLAAMFISDLALQVAHGTGFHSTMWAVYGSFVLITCLGLWLRNQPTNGRIVFASLAASLLFFLITNFAVWLNGTMYPQNLGGLIACYGAGIPFYQHEFFGSALMNTVMGDLFFSTLLFGGYKLFSYQAPRLREERIRRK
jgi:hypothetical protein